MCVIIILDDVDGSESEMQQHVDVWLCTQSYSGTFNSVSIVIATETQQATVH